MKRQGILIDAFKKTIALVEFDDRVELGSLLGVENSPLTVALRDGDKGELQLLVDDEGMFKEGSLPGFNYEGFQQTLAGSGMLIQVDDEGDETQITSTTVEEIQKKVTFTTLLNSAKEKMLSESPQFISLDHPKDVDLSPTRMTGSILDRYKKFVDENPETFLHGQHNPVKDTRLIFIQDDLFKETVCMMQGIIRPGMPKMLARLPVPTTRGTIATKLIEGGTSLSNVMGVSHIATDDPRPFFLGEPFNSIWIESVRNPICSVNGDHGPRKIHAVWLWRSGDGMYSAVMVGDWGAQSTIISDGSTLRPELLQSDDSYYQKSVVHAFLFHLFRALARGGQLGTERVNERFRAGKGKDREQIKIKDIIHIRAKKTSKKIAAPVPGPQIDWSHRWEVMGHWRKITGVGKDDRDHYHIQGYTWVRPHTKGPEEKELVTKTRVYMFGKESKDLDGKD